MGAKDVSNIIRKLVDGMSHIQAAEFFYAVSAKKDTYAALAKQQADVLNYLQVVLVDKFIDAKVVDITVHHLGARFYVFKGSNLSTNNDDRVNYCRTVSGKDAPTYRAMMEVTVKAATFQAQLKAMEQAGKKIPAWVKKSEYTIVKMGKQKG